MALFFYYFEERCLDRVWNNMIGESSKCEMLVSEFQNNRWKFHAH
jgi:hypothetical protein